MANPKASPDAEKNKAPQATEAAEMRAEEEGVALEEAEPSGKGGKVTVQDVEEVAKAKEASESVMVYVDFNRDAFTGAGDRVEHDGITYVYNPDLTPQVVSERYFDDELEGLTNFEGVNYFEKGGVASDG